ncbi:AAA family ATPase [Paludisphaera borealis]|uniref:Septum site-determining protein MinD n=1 Tax=Paludisphaera borealis TaxID=1387353 RepID=A0A1U7CLM2_9BACT|nr:AAA family ATPase [Paludisphaera borealis]APW59835.1 Septum site-determining protein MinD [Paludisphaera borealis]
MKDVIRVVLVDPSEPSRTNLQRLVQGVASLWTAEVLTTCQGMAGRIAEINPDLCVIGLDADPAQALELIAQIHATAPSVVVLPASATADSTLILKAVRAGAREFLTLPSEPTELHEIAARLCTAREGRKSIAIRGPQIVAVTGAAGGVGSTSVAVNLAASLALRKSQECLLLDFDLMFGAVDVCLDIIPDNTLSTILQSFDRLDQTLLKRSLTRHRSGLYVLPHPVAMEDAAKIDPESLRRFLMLLKSAFPALVIDTSKGLQASDFVAFEMADVILIVVTLDLTCLRNTARLLNLFRQFDGMVDRVKIVVNRAGSFENEISLSKAEETLKAPIFRQIPNASKPFQASRIKGAPLSEAAPGTRVYQDFLELTGALWPESPSENQKPRKGLFAAFF